MAVERPDSLPHILYLSPVLADQRRGENNAEPGVERNHMGRPFVSRVLSARINQRTFMLSRMNNPEEKTPEALPPGKNTSEYRTYSEETGTSMQLPSYLFI